VVPDALLEEVARRFALLGDPTRLRLLKALQEGRELSVGNLAAASGVARVNVSQHLNVMRDAGLVATRRDGTSVFYHLAYPQILQACDIVHDVLRAQLVDLGALAGG